MENYKEYLDIKVNLINTILLGLPRNILDISFDYDKETLTIQFVLLSGTSLDDLFICKIDDCFCSYTVIKDYIYISKEKYNENIGGWIPSGYTWLKYNLYSKAEVL